MSGKEHHYSLALVWDSDDSSSTHNYNSYSRDHQITIEGKGTLNVSADPAFKGSKELWNPEDQLVAALSSCHMLTYLDLASRHKLLVLAYEDRATGLMVQEGNGGRFTEVTLNPSVTLAEGSDEKIAAQLHHDAHNECFIANSVNFPVDCLPSFLFKKV